MEEILNPKYGILNIKSNDCIADSSASNRLLMKLGKFVLQSNTRWEGIKPLMLKNETLAQTSQARAVLNSHFTLFFKSMSVQLSHADERFKVFALEVFCIRTDLLQRLDGKNDIQSVKSAWLVLHAGLEDYVLPHLQGNNKERKTNKHTSIQGF